MSNRTKTRWIRCVVRVVAVLVSLTVGTGVCRAGQITLLGAMHLPNSVFVSDVWGYYDSVTMREYAIVGDWHGDKVFVVDVTSPANMTLVAEVGGVPGFDVKVWDHYIYSCDGSASGVDSRIIDINDPANPVVLPRAFFSAHNISISSNGLMALEFPGLRLLDVATNPEIPNLLWEDTDPEGHDSTPRGSRLYDFAGRNDTVIWDVTGPANPIEIGRVSDPSIVFHHSGDATDNGNYLFVCDELARHPVPDVTIWDISTPAAPSKVGQITDAGASVHNLYIVGDVAYVSFYSSGFKAYDISDPSNPALIDRFDTSPLSGEGFVGCFGVYPFATSGRVYASDIDTGLFVFSVDPSPSPQPADEPGATLAQNYPNPFNPTTTIPYEITRAGRVRVSVFTARGSLVRTLVDRHYGPGAYSVEWNGTTAAGGRAASGVYLYRLETPTGVQTRRMVMLK